MRNQIRIDGVDESEEGVDGSNDPRPLGVMTEF